MRRYALLAALALALLLTGCSDVSTVTRYVFVHQDGSVSICTTFDRPPRTNCEHLGGAP